MKARCPFLFFLLFTICLGATGWSQTEEQAEYHRKAVKNRKAADGANYTNHNNGAAITVAKWFGLVCGFDSKVKGK